MGSHQLLQILAVHSFAPNNWKVKEQGITFSFDCQQETVVSSPPLRLVLYFSALLIFTEAPVVSAGPWPPLRSGKAICADIHHRNPIPLFLTSSHRKNNQNTESASRGAVCSITGSSLPANVGRACFISGPTQGGGSSRLRNNWDASSAYWCQLFNPENLDLTRHSFEIWQSSIAQLTCIFNPSMVMPCTKYTFRRLVCCLLMLNLTHESAQNLRADVGRQIFPR